MLGSPDATVTMIQFEDLQCPVCKRYQEEGLPGIVEEYVRPGKLKLRFAGLAFIGPDSEKALLHVIAAGEREALAVRGRAVREPGRGELGLGDGRAAEARRRRPAARLREAPEGRRQQGRPRSGERDGHREHRSARYPARRRGSTSRSATASPRVRPSSFAVEEFRQILDDALRGLASPPPSSSDRALRFGVGVVALIGAAVAGYLTYVHFRPESLICTGGGGCETVQESVVRRLLRHPVALLGLLAYLAVAGLPSSDAWAGPVIAAQLRSAGSH